MGLEGISRIEEYFPVKDENADYDPMLQRMYKGLDQNVFTTNRQPEPIIYIEDLEVYNEKRRFGSFQRRNGLPEESRKGPRTEADRL